MGSDSRMLVGGVACSRSRGRSRADDTVSSCEIILSYHNPLPNLYISSSSLFVIGAAFFANPDMLSAVQNLLPSVLQFNHDSNHSKNLDNGHNGESTHSPTHASSPAENTLVQQQSEAPEGVDELGMRKKRLPTVNEVSLPSLLHAAHVC